MSFILNAPFSKDINRLQHKRQLDSTGNTPDVYFGGH